MYPVSNPMPQGIGGLHHISDLSLKPEDILPSRADGRPAARPSHGVPVDDVRISDRARLHMVARAAEVPSPADTPEDDGLLSAARDAQQFLNEHPRIASSPFGMSVTLLIRGAVHLARTDGAGDLPDDSKAKLMRAVERVEAFLADHPRVADSSFGESAATLASGIASFISVAGDDTDPGTTDSLFEAARRAASYLDEHPKLAGMPLGQVVGRLVDGVQSLAADSPLDADLQTLAKRVGHFVQTHPRLAESEFGQIVSHLVRGIVAYDATTPPVVATEAEASAVAELTPAVETVDDEDVRQAA